MLSRREAMMALAAAGALPMMVACARAGSEKSGGAPAAPTEADALGDDVFGLEAVTVKIVPAPK